MSVRFCFECMGLMHCYGTYQPALQREEARILATQCDSLHKGIGTQTVTVLNERTGMSRKNAERLVNEGSARWIETSVIELLDPDAARLRRRFIPYNKRH